MNERLSLFLILSLILALSLPILVHLTLLLIIELIVWILYVALLQWVLLYGFPVIIATIGLLLLWRFLNPCIGVIPILLCLFLVHGLTGILVLLVVLVHGLLVGHQVGLFYLFHQGSYLLLGIYDSLFLALVLCIEDGLILDQALAEQLPMVLWVVLTLVLLFLVLIQIVN